MNEPQTDTPMNFDKRLDGRKALEESLAKRRSETEAYTPRTDACWAARTECNILDHARQLERELAAVTKQRDALAEAIRKHKRDVWPLTGEKADNELWGTLATLQQNIND